MYDSVFERNLELERGEAARLLPEFPRPPSIALGLAVAGTMRSLFKRVVVDSPEASCGDIFYAS
jgi:hypothetical protein